MCRCCITKATLVSHAGTSSTTELYLTGAQPSTASFPSPAVRSSYQHTAAYTSRSYSSNHSLALQDPAFSTSTNGLFSHHDPLLHRKSSQTMLPAALAFNHFSSPVLGSALPVQSSTYRSAQESAPHLLQPQLSLVPSALRAPHSSPQGYGATVFSGSTERALQRECSVIKHHQRPSSNHTASEQLPTSEHSLQGYRYFGSGSEGDISYQQDLSRQTPVTCSPSTEEESSQGVNSALQPKTDSVTQTYPSMMVPKEEDCSSELTPHSVGGDDNHTLTAESPGQKQNSVIANQQSAVQLSSFMSSSLSQPYMTPHTQSQPFHPTPYKLSSLYKMLPSRYSPSGDVASVSQTLVYPTSPGLSQEKQVQYGIQQGLCPGPLSEHYPSMYSQGATDVSYTSPSQRQVSVSRSQSFFSGRSHNSSNQPTCERSLPTSISTQDYALMQASVGSKTLSQHSTVQTKSFYGCMSATYSSPAQENSITTSVEDIKPTYGKEKLEELPMQDIQALQSMEVSAADSSMTPPNNVNYVVSKVDDHHKAQSVIRGSSRSDEQLMGLGPVKDERMSSLRQQQHIGCANSQENTTTTASSIISSHVLMSQPNPIESPESHLQNHQEQSQNQTPASHTQYITVPSTQVLLEPNRRIRLQQPLVHHRASKVQGIQPVQGLGPIRQCQLDVAVSKQNSGCSDSSKRHYSLSVNQQSSDTKNHFAICFRESMLLADDRNISSNVDDILVAPCGGAPQGFVKGTSSAEADIAAMDAKGHFQTVDMRDISPSISTAQQPISTDAHAMAMTLNSHSINCHGQSVHHNSSSHLDANGGGGSESDYHIAGQAFDSLGYQNKDKGRTKLVKTEEGLTEGQGVEDLHKKAACSKSLIKEDENGQSKCAKRTALTKRLNSRGGEVSSPSAPQSVFDTCPQQERIRQKIREVEEKQPEVKTGFIGSFLDFIKSGSKQQFSPSPTRAVSRPRKTGTVTKPAPCTLPALTPELETLPGPVVPRENPGASAQHKRLEEDLQKNLETLPSFSSDEEENTGKNQALRNSISSALSVLDESSDRKPRTGKKPLAY